MCYYVHTLERYLVPSQCCAATSSISKTLSSPQEEPPYLVTVTLHFHQPLVTTNLLFASINVSILGMSYKWNHTVCKPFYFGLLSPSIMFPKFIHVVAVFIPSTSFYA